MVKKTNENQSFEVEIFVVDWLQDIVVKWGGGVVVICTLIVLLCIGCSCSGYHIHISRCMVLDDDVVSEWRELKCLTPLELLLRKFS